jgi:glycosyltransferase involved in cell wall biosynthesis
LLSEITPLILTFNEEANIGRALSHLAWASRVVVVDSHSTDGTLEVLRGHSRVDLFQRPFDSFAAQCNFGLERVATEWVLSLDADYICHKALVDEMANLRGDAPVEGYWAPFRYCVFGKPLKGTLYPPRIVLFRRDAGHYVQDGHAHRLRLQGRTGRLKHPILHDDRKPLAAWLRAQDRYASDEASKLLATPRHQLNRIDRLRTKKLVVPFLAPIYCLLWRGLVFDGAAGWYYTFQRTFAELLLSLRLLDRKLRQRQNRDIPCASRDGMV